MHKPCNIIIKKKSNLIFAIDYFNKYINISFMETIKQTLSSTLSFIIIFCLFFYSLIVDTITGNKLEINQVTTSKETITFKKGVMLIHYKNKCKTDFLNCSVINKNNYTIKPVYTNHGDCIYCNPIKNFNKMQQVINRENIQYLPSNTKLPIFSVYHARKKESHVFSPDYSYILAPPVIYLLKLPNGQLAEFNTINKNNINLQPSNQINDIDYSYKKITQTAPKISFHYMKQFCTTRNQLQDSMETKIEIFKDAFNISNESINYQDGQCLLNPRKQKDMPAINLVFSRFNDFLIFEHYSKKYDIHGFKRPQP
jgi:hypothetical protein